MENPWVVQVPRELLPKERRSIEIFGLEIARRERQIDLGRLFMARFGDIGRIEARGRDVLVTLKSGTVFDLDRLSASDFDDGVRVWDGRRGVVDLGPRRIRIIELLPTARLGAATSTARRASDRSLTAIDPSPDPPAQRDARAFRINDLFVRPAKLPSHLSVYTVYER